MPNLIADNNGIPSNFGLPSPPPRGFHCEGIICFDVQYRAGPFRDFENMQLYTWEAFEEPIVGTTGIGFIVGEFLGGMPLTQEFTVQRYAEYKWYVPEYRYQRYLITHDNGTIKNGPLSGWQWTGGPLIKIWSGIDKMQLEKIITCMVACP